MLRMVDILVINIRKVFILKPRYYFVWAVDIEFFSLFHIPPPKEVSTALFYLYILSRDDENE